MISQPKQVLVLLKLFFDSTLANLYATQNSSRRGLLNTASENRPLFHSKPLSGSPFQSEQKQKPLLWPKLYYIPDLARLCLSNLSYSLALPQGQLCEPAISTRTQGPLLK